MWEWLWWTGLITFSLLIIEALFVFDFFLVLITEIIGIGTLVWIRFRGSRRCSPRTRHKLARERYYTKQKFADPEATIRRRGGGGRQARARPAPPALSVAPARDDRCPSRSAGSASGIAAPRARPGRSGLTGQPIHSDGRGLIAELAFARGARIEPHANPNTTWFVVIEGGGWVGVGDERTRVAAGEAVLWPADVPHAAWTEHSEMRAFVVEFTGPDDSAVVGLLEGRRGRRSPPTRLARAAGRSARWPSDRRPADRRIPTSGEPA